MTRTGLVRKDMKREEEEEEEEKEELLSLAGCRRKRKKSIGQRVGDDALALHASICMICSSPSLFSSHLVILSRYLGT